jgi:hypothetical protein
MFLSSPLDQTGVVWSRLLLHFVFQAYRAARQYFLVHSLSTLFYGSNHVICCFALLISAIRCPLYVNVSILGLERQECNDGHLPAEHVAEALSCPRSSQKPYSDASASGREPWFEVCVQRRSMHLATKGRGSFPPSSRRWW